MRFAPKEVFEGGASIASGFLTMAMNLGLMATAGYLIASAALRPSTVLLLWVPIVLVRFFGIFRGVFRYADRMLSHDVTFRILSKLRTRWFARLEPLFPLPVAQHQLGELLENAVKDIDLLQNVFLRVLSPIVVATLTSIVSLCIVCHYGLIYGFILLPCLLIAGVILPAITYVKAKHRTAKWVDQRALLTSSMIDTVAGAAEILAFGREKDWTKKVNAHIKEIETSEKRTAHLDSLVNALTVIMPGLAAWMMMRVGVRAVALHQLSGIALTVLTLITLSAFESLQAIPSAFLHIGESKRAWNRLNQLVKLNKAEKETSQNTLKTFDVLPSLDLTFENLSFRYERQGRDVLNDVTFSVPAGKRFAIVGSNGSGKSTLINLISGIYTAQDGTIRVNGIALNEWDKVSLREQLAVVSQKTYIFSATLLDNLRLGAPNASIEEVKCAVQRVGLSNLVSRLPDGLLTWIGDGGIPLSGGERQRIGIARALLRDTPLIILDEPTEGLDTDSERTIIAMLNHVFRGKTMIYVTHRLMALPEMDEIIVMDNGQVVEVGAHKLLISKQGMYFKLWRIEQDMLGSVSKLMSQHNFA